MNVMKSRALVSLRALQRLGAAIAVSTLMIGGGMAEADAASTTGTPSISSSGAGTITQSSTVALSTEKCQAMRQANPKTTCTEVITTTETPVSVATAQAQGVDTSSLSAAATSCKTVSQSRQDGDGGAVWKFTQYVTFCYNGSTIATQSQSCVMNYNNLFDYSKDDCSNFVAATGLVRYRNIYSMYFKVLGHGLSGTFRQWIDAKVNGTVSYYHD